MNLANKQFPGEDFLRQSSSCGDCQQAHCESCLSERYCELNWEDTEDAGSAEIGAQLGETRWIILILNAKFDFSWFEQ